MAQFRQVLRSRPQRRACVAIGLADYGKPGNYFARQSRALVTTVSCVPTERIPAMDRLIDWLPDQIIW